MLTYLGRWPFRCLGPRLLSKKTISLKSFVTFPLIFSFVPYRLAFRPPPPKDIIFHFCWQSKTMDDVERDPQFLLCVWVPLQTSPPGEVRRVEGKCPYNGCIVQYVIIATRPPLF